MNYEIKHWPILPKLGNDLLKKVRSFMVVGENGDGLLVATENGEGFWFGTIKFGSSVSRTAIEPTPLDVPGLVQMAQGHKHILLLNESGQIYAMGKNDLGPFGLGTVDQETRFSPQLISIPHKFTSVRCGVWNSLALTEDGKVWAWGKNRNCQLEVPDSAESFLSPRKISELDPHRVVAVECGGYHSLALTDQGEVYVWGDNYWGQLGDRSGISKHIPTRISTCSRVKSMAAGSGHTLLLTQTGEVYACGSNQYGQLGLRTTTKSSTSLVKVAGLPLISQIASHYDTHQSIAISPSQNCFVWGLLRNQTLISTPMELPPFYSTVESPLSFYSTQRNTPHSVLHP